jgi:hypothetical protein
LASYLEGTPDDGILHVQLKKQRWSVTCGKGMTHLSRMKLQFQIGRQMEDSFWRQSAIPHGLIAKQLEGLPFRVISVALSSCEAELYVANGLVMESLFLYRLCKFLVEGNSDKVQQIVHGLSLSIGTYLSNWDWTFETHSDQAILSSKFAAYWCVFCFQSSKEAEPW